MALVAAIVLPAKALHMTQKHATDFSSLLEAVADEKNNTLSSVLFKAKLLASRLGSPPFRDWVRAELEGYPVDSVPEYRIIKPGLRGEFWGPGGYKLRNVPLTTNHLDATIRNLLENFPFPDNIGGLQALLDTDEVVFIKTFPFAVVEHFREYPCIEVPDAVLQSISTIFTKAAVQSVLHAIRSRLLDFLIELKDRFPELEADNGAFSTISTEEVARIVDKTIYNHCTIFSHNGAGDIQMGDKYQAGQAGAMGPGAHAHHMSFQQIWNQNSDTIDIGQLESELVELRTALATEASDPEHQIAIGSIAAAEKAAAAGNGAKSLEYLKSGGKWALTIAEKIGVPVATAALKAALSAG